MCVRLWDLAPQKLSPDPLLHPSDIKHTNHLLCDFNINSLIFFQSQGNLEKYLQQKYLTMWLKSAFDLDQGAASPTVDISELKFQSLGKREIVLS